MVVHAFTRMKRLLVVSVALLIGLFGGATVPVAHAANVQPLTVQLNLVNAPANGTWQVGDRMLFDVVLTVNDTGTYGYRSIATNLEARGDNNKSIDDCRFSSVKGPFGPTTCSKYAAHIVTAEDVAHGFTPSATYAAFVAGSKDYSAKTNPVTTFEPALGTKQNVTAAADVTITHTNPKQTPWTAGEVMFFKVKVTNKADEKRGFNGVNAGTAGSNLSFLHGRPSNWGNVDSGASVEAMMYHEITVAEAQAGTFTPAVTFNSGYQSGGSTYSGIDPLSSASPVTTELVDTADKAVAHNKALNTANASTDLTTFKNKLSSDESLRWVFAGDSITQGVGLTDGIRHYSEYINQLLHSDASTGLNRPQDRVINSGNWGVFSSFLTSNNSNDAKGGANYTAMITDKKPDIVFLAYGMNDAGAHSAFNAENVEALKTNLSGLIDRLRQENILPVLQTQNYRRGNGGDLEVRNRNLSVYFQAVRDLAAEKKVILIDESGHWLSTNADKSRNNELIGDNVHPTAKGQFEWARYLADVLDMNTTSSGSATELSSTSTASIARPDGNANNAVVLDNAVTACAGRVEKQHADALVTIPVGQYFGGAAHMDATSEQVSSLRELTSYTIVTRAKFDSSIGGGMLAALSNSAGNQMVGIRVVPGGYGAAGKAQLVYSDTTGYFTRGQHNIGDGAWHVIAMSVTPTQTALYVDGVLQGSSISSPHIPQSLASLNIDSLTIGARHNSDGYKDNFNGSIDYVQVYGSALNATQISALNPSSKYGEPLNLSAYINNGGQASVSDPYGASNYDGTPNTWAFFGGEAAAGVTAPIQAKNFIEMFEDALRFESGGANGARTYDLRMKQVINEAQAGDTSANLVNRYSASVTDQTKVVYIAPDVVKNGATLESLDTFTSNIKQLAQNVTQSNRVAVLVTPLTTSTLATPYANALTSIANELGAGVYVIDAHQFLRDAQESDSDVDTQWFDSSGILNYRGHLAVGRFIIERSGMTLSTGSNLHLATLHYDHSSSASQYPESYTGGTTKGERLSKDIDDQSDHSTVRIDMSDAGSFCAIPDGNYTVQDVTNPDAPVAVDPENISVQGTTITVKNVDNNPHTYRVVDKVTVKPTFDASGVKVAAGDSAPADVADIPVHYAQFDVLGLVKAQIDPVAVFVDKPHSDQDNKFILPQQQGVMYSVAVNGAKLDDPSTYDPQRGDKVTVTAQAAKGYELAQGSPEEFKHTYIKVTATQGTKEVDAVRAIKGENVTDLVVTAQPGNGGTVTYRLAQGSTLPNGLTLNAQTGAITGQANQTGETSVTVIAEEKLSTAPVQPLPEENRAVRNRAVNNEDEPVGTANGAHVNDGDAVNSAEDAPTNNSQSVISADQITIAFNVTEPIMAPQLPTTGGVGEILFILLGVVLAAIGLLTVRTEGTTTRA